MFRLNKMKENISTCNLRQCGLGRSIHVHVFQSIDTQVTL